MYRHESIHGAHMSEKDEDERQIDLIDYIENAHHAGPPMMEKTFSDKELNNAGLIAVKAFVRSKTSKNAERVRKAKERRESGDNGPPRKQLNLQAPIDDEAREVLREMNTALLKHSLTAQDIREVLGQKAMDWRQRALDAERALAEAEKRIDTIHQEYRDRPPRWLGWPISWLFRKGK